MSPSAAVPPAAAEGAVTGSALFRFWKSDLLSGFLVFLIALPLCIAISLASGYPAIAGVYTAIIGGMVTSFISNSELTIKGPAAGLIVIAVGAVGDLGAEAVPALSAAQSAQLEAEGASDGQRRAALKNEQMRAGYPLALGVGVVAAAIQVLLGLLHAGRLGDFFPLSAVHGMLAAIGITIFAKQVPVALGVLDLRLGDPDAGDTAIPLLLRIPQFVAHAYWPVAMIGLVSLVVLFGLPLVGNRTIRRIPAPMIVLVVSIPMAYYVGLQHGADHYVVKGKNSDFHDAFDVTLPNMISGLTLPRFDNVLTATGVQYIIMFALIGSIESLLSAKAIDLLDPWKRKTNLDRDLLAVGVANLGAACVGGLPMISEIVRSKANIDNGARTRLADGFHAIFLLICVALFAQVLMMIPLAALAAMLIYTGFRLGSPREFVHALHVGWDQFLVFVTTVMATLASDLLKGVATGIAMEFALHLLRGLGPKSLFLAEIAAEAPEGGETVLVRVRRAAVFSNWLGLKGHIHRLGPDVNVVIDLSEAQLVDHTVMKKLHEMEGDFAQRGKSFVVCGLEKHEAVSCHPLASRSQRQGTTMPPPAL